MNEAIKACRDKRDGDWLLILGFAFESGLQEITTRDFGSFRVSIVRMHDDLLQEGLLKRDKKAASFVTIGEPDIRLHRKNGTATVEIVGLDIYDPIRDEVKSRDVHDIAYWMLDDDYDGSNFVVRQVFFCGGDKDEFDAWKKGLSNLAAAKTKKAVEQTLKLEIDDEAFATPTATSAAPSKSRKAKRSPSASSANSARRPQKYWSYDRGLPSYALMSDAVEGAIVGGAIGFVAALAAALLPMLFAFRNDQYRRAFRAYSEYASWLRGLIPECEFLLQCVDELQPAFSTGGQVTIPTKRFNYDFLGAARTEMIKHPRSITLFPRLTAAYRNIVHTNDMMDRLEEASRELHSSTMAQFAFQGLFQSTAACFPATRASLESLLNLARELDQLEIDHPPTLLDIGDA